MFFLSSKLKVNIQKQISQVLNIYLHISVLNNNVTDNWEKPFSPLKYSKLFHSISNCSLNVSLEQVTQNN